MVTMTMNSIQIRESGKLSTFSVYLKYFATN